MSASSSSLSLRCSAGSRRWWRSSWGCLAGAAGATAGVVDGRFVARDDGRRLFASLAEAVIVSPALSVLRLLGLLSSQRIGGRGGGRSSGLEQPIEQRHPQQRQQEEVLSGGAEWKEQALEQRGHEHSVMAQQVGTIAWDEERAEPKRSSDHHTASRRDPFTAVRCRPLCTGVPILIRVPLLCPHGSAPRVGGW